MADKSFLYPSFSSRVLEVIRFRRSVRRFIDKPIEKAKLELILEAARLAPSSTNSQPWHFIVVTDRKIIAEIARAEPYGLTRFNSWIANAPVVIACLARPRLFSHRLGRLVGKDFHLVDCAIAIEHMVLVAAELGIGSCWVGWFDAKKVRRALKVPAGYEIVVLLPLGYPEQVGDAYGIGGIGARRRKEVAEIASLNSFGSPFV